MKLILDRIEALENGKRIAVFELPDGNYTDIYEDDMPVGMIDRFVDGIIIDAEYKDNKIIRAELLFEETEKKKEEMKKRLNKILNRNKK